MLIICNFYCDCLSVASLPNLKCKRDQTVIVKKRDKRAMEVLRRQLRQSQEQVRQLTTGQKSMLKCAQHAEKNRDIAVADVSHLLDLARANHLHVPPTLVQSRFVTSQTVANIGSSPPLVQSPDLPVGARLVENDTSQHDTSLHDTPLHDLPSTPAEFTPSSSLPVPSSCDIVSGIGHASRTPLSPRRHTNMELAAAGVRKACLPEVIYKNMLLANTVCAALRRIGRETTDQKKLITALLSGPEIKRARLRSTICKKVGISERTVRRKTDMSLQDSTKKRSIRPAASDELRHTIYVFLSRDDNSSLCPAKAASTCCEEGRKQNHILSDYVYALHLKFLSENTDMKVSQSLFYRLVPKHIKFSKDLKVRSCLCEKCENFQHLLRRYVYNMYIIIYNSSQSCPRVYL